MKILVLSDSHYQKVSFDESYDKIIHCGDYGKSLDVLSNDRCIYVCGNCDRVGKKHQVFELFNKLIFVTHGDLENVKYGRMSLVYRALEYNANICFFGHTHNQEYFIEKGILFINPGVYPECYVEIEDNQIIFYNGNNKKNIDFKW